MYIIVIIEPKHDDALIDNIIAYQLHTPPTTRCFGSIFWGAHAHASAEVIDIGQITTYKR